MKNKKRQQKAQSRQTNARHRQQERAMRNIRLVEHAEKRWQQTQSLLSQLGATLQQTKEEQKGVLRVVYLVTYKGQTQTLRSQSGVRRWIKRIRHPVQEEMSWAERHVWWMIENNCDDFGNPWPE
jgi:hypothetical protein